MRVGVTGHQKLEDSHLWSWVADTMRQELAKIAPPLIAVTSLAIGADQLLAELVLERGGTLHAILPFADIERSFAPADVPAYRKLLHQATVEVLNTTGTDEDAYLAAGERVVDMSETMFAVWNARPAKGKGGTADIVAYARRQGVPVVHINPMTQTVQRLSSD